MLSLHSTSLLSLLLICSAQEVRYNYRKLCDAFIGAKCQLSLFEIILTLLKLFLKITSSGHFKSIGRSWSTDESNRDAAENVSFRSTTNKKILLRDNRWQSKFFVCSSQLKNWIGIERSDSDNLIFVAKTTMGKIVSRKNVAWKEKKHLLPF